MKMKLFLVPLRVTYTQNMHTYIQNPLGEFENTEVKFILIIVEEQKKTLNVARWVAIV